MQFTALSALAALVFTLGAEAAAFEASSAVTVTIVPSSADHHSRVVSSTFATPTTFIPSSPTTFPTTIAPSASPTFVPGNNGAFLCFPIASGFAVPDLNGTIIFPNGSLPVQSAIPSSGGFATGTAVTSSAFATATAVATTAFGSAAPSSAFATASSAPTTTF